MAQVTLGKLVLVIVAIHPSLVSLMGPRTFPGAKQKIAPCEWDEQSTIVVYFTFSEKYCSSDTTKSLKPDRMVSRRASLTLLALSAFMTESPAAFPCFAVSVRPANSISLKLPEIAEAES